MPMYDFECDGETVHRFERYLSLRDNDNPKCENCGAETHRVLGLANTHVPGGHWPFTTTHLSGKPETFSDQASLNRRMKELGVVQRDDASFITKRYDGVNYRTGKQKYHEGWGGERGRTWF